MYIYIYIKLFYIIPHFSVVLSGPGCAGRGLDSPTGPKSVRMSRQPFVSDSICSARIVLGQESFPCGRVTNVGSKLPQGVQRAGTQRTTCSSCWTWKAIRPPSKTPRPQDHFRNAQKRMEHGACDTNELTNCL